MSLGRYLGGRGGKWFICILEVWKQGSPMGAPEQEHRLPLVWNSRADVGLTCCLLPSLPLETLLGLDFPPSGCVLVNDFCFPGSPDPPCCLAPLSRAGRLTGALAGGQRAGTFLLSKSIFSAPGFWAWLSRPFPQWGPSLSLWCHFAR